MESRNDFSKPLCWLWLELICAWLSRCQRKRFHSSKEVPCTPQFFSRWGHFGHDLCCDWISTADNSMIKCDYLLFSYTTPKISILFKLFPSAMIIDFVLEHSNDLSLRCNKFPFGGLAPTQKKKSYAKHELNITKIMSWEYLQWLYISPHTQITGWYCRYTCL